MISIANAVQQIVNASDFGLEGLQTGCLNLSAYASYIRLDVEQLTKKPVQKGSIVVALARLAKKYQEGSAQPNFKLYNLVSRTGLTEITYHKSPSLQKRISKLFEQPDIQTASFCVATFGLGEIAIITHDDLAQAIREQLHGSKPSLYHQNLSSLTMQVDAETINMPRQSYTIIKQLALRDITIMEYVTSPTELTIVLRESELKSAFAILHDRFFKTV